MGELPRASSELSAAEPQSGRGPYLQFSGAWSRNGSGGCRKLQLELAASLFLVVRTITLRR
jgi:hypothetical protein